MIVVFVLSLFVPNLSFFCFLGKAVLHVLWHFLGICLFVLRFYGPVNPMGSCQEQSVYLITHLLGRLSPLSS